MKIGIVTTWFERGAAYVSRAYRDALCKWAEVYIYARGGEVTAVGDPTWDSDSVWWAPRLGGTRVDGSDFRRWLNCTGVELVVFNEQRWWPPVLWARENGCRTVAYVDYYTPWTVEWFKAYDGLWCNTRRHYSVFTWHAGALYVPWGTDLRVFQPQKTEQRGTPVFFHSAGMGGLHLRKGTDLLVEAFARVGGAARLIIHSQVPLERYGAASGRIAADCRIQFMERTVSAPGLYHLGDVYVYPTRLDGLGLTVPEALACGLPVIATDTAPCTDFVVPDQSGWLVRVATVRARGDDYYWPETECDVGGLAERMQWCVDNRGGLPLWQSKARAFAVRNLDWTKNAGVLKAHLEAIMRGPPARVPRRIRRAIERQDEARLGWIAKAGKSGVSAARRWRAPRRGICQTRIPLVGAIAEKAMDGLAEAVKRRGL